MKKIVILSLVLFGLAFSSQAQTLSKDEIEKYENENNTKLFVMALPFLSKLFMKEAEQVPFRDMPA